MTYNDRFVAELKWNGKILRIKDDTAYLPFGSEYSLLLKNLNTRRASVNIEIDGQDVLDNKSLIIDPNATTELMGFLKGATARNKFKFIQKTKQIQHHRGDKVDDGIVRIEFAFEKAKPEPWIAKTITEVKTTFKGSPDITHYGSNADYWNFSASAGDPRNQPRGVTSDNLEHTYNCSVENLGVTPQQEEGITVKGSEIEQDFRYASMGELEDAKVIVIKLRGLTHKGVDIDEPVTTRDKLICSICGTKSTSSAKYCSNCGAFLE
jgi:hypothetical protein